MFSKNMSYYEIINALRDAADFNVLTLFQKSCLQNSLRNPFVLGLFNLYPAKPLVQQIVNAALAQQRAGRNNVDQEVPNGLNVHSSVLSEQRARTKEYLLKNFHADADESLIATLDAFIRKAIADKEVIEELVVAHKLRLIEFRMPELSGYDIEILKESIPDDFISYLEYLQDLNENNTSFAWTVLACLLNRMSSLPTELQSANELQLMRALDDARTAYFGQSYKFFEGKDYSCLQGLEERFLDHHAYLVERVVQKDYEKNIEPLFAPYIQSVKDENGLHLKYAPSKLMIHLYASFAGYIPEAKEHVLFQCPPEISEESLCLLQHEYIAQKHGMSIDEVTYLITLHSTEPQSLESLIPQSRLKRRLVLSEYVSLQTLMSLLKSGSAAYEKDNTPNFIEFWQAQQNIPRLSETLETQLELEFVQNGQRRSETEIIEAMANSAFFIDKAHVLTIAALIPFQQIEDILQVDPTVHNVDEQLCDKFGLIAHYSELKESLSNMYRNYYDFYLDALDVDLLGRDYLNSQICSEEVFLYFLEKQKAVLTRANKKQYIERYAVLCVKSGYSRALAVLISEYKVSPDIASTQEELTLLQMACSEGSLDVVKVLLHFGASPYVMYKRGYLHKLPLHFAAACGHLDIVKELLDFGVDINQTTESCNLTPLMAAISASQPAAAEFLIEAGASLTCVTSDGETVLMHFHRKPLTNSMISLLHRILNLLKENKENFNQIVNLLPITDSNTSTPVYLNRMAKSILGILVSANKKELIDMLVHMNAELDLITDFSYCLPFFVECCSLEALQHCIERQYISIKDKGVDNKTLIEYAVINNTEPIFKYLLELHNTNFPDETKELLSQSWFTAAKSSALDIMKFLKKYDKALVTSIDSEGKTAFFYAISTPILQDVYKSIYNRKFDFSQKDFLGNSVLVYAANLTDYNAKRTAVFLFENSQKNMSPDDFEMEHQKSTIAALEAGNKEVFQTLALYNTKKILDNELFEISMSPEDYSRFFEIYQGQEVQFFAVIALSLLREQKDKNKVLKIAFIEEFAFDLLSQLLRRLEIGPQMSKIEMGLLNLTIQVLWGDNSFHFGANQRQTKGKLEKSTGLLVISNSITYLKILNKLLLIKLQYIPKEEKKMLFEMPAPYMAQTTFSKRFKDSPEKKAHAREMINIIIGGILNEYHLTEFEKVLQTLSDDFNILQILVEQTGSLKLVCTMVTSVLTFSTFERYQEATTSVREYAAAHHQKNIELALTAFANKYVIQKQLHEIALENEKEDLDKIINSLKGLFGKAWYIHSVIAIFVLNEQCAIKNKLLSYSWSISHSFRHAHLKNLLYKLLRSALSSLSKHVVSSNIMPLNEEQIMTINMLLSLLKDSKAIKQYEAESLSQGQETASVSMTVTDFLIEISHEMNRLQPYSINGDAAAVGRELLTFSSKRLYSEVEAQDIENPSKLTRLLSK